MPWEWAAGAWALFWVVLLVRELVVMRRTV